MTTDLFRDLAAQYRFRPIRFVVERSGYPISKLITKMFLHLSLQSKAASSRRLSTALRMMNVIVHHP